MRAVLEGFGVNSLAALTALVIWVASNVMGLSGYPPLAEADPKSEIGTSIRVIEEVKREVGTKQEQQIQELRQAIGESKRILSEEEEEEEEATSLDEAPQTEGSSRIENPQSGTVQ